MKTEHHHRGVRWLPSSPDVHRSWIGELLAEVERNPAPLHPVLADFQAFIEGDAEAYMLFSQMFEQASTKAPYADEAEGEAQVRDYKTMLRLFNALLTRATASSRQAARTSYRCGDRPPSEATSGPTRRKMLPYPSRTVATCACPSWNAGPGCPAVPYTGVSSRAVSRCRSRWTATSRPGGRARWRTGWPTPADVAAGR